MRGRADRSFVPLLNEAFLIDALERDHHLVIGLWPDCAIAYLNPRAARLLGGEAQGAADPTLLGANLLAYLPKPRRAGFEATVALAPTAQESVYPAQLQFELLAPRPLLQAQACLFPLAERRAFVLLTGAVPMTYQRLTLVAGGGAEVGMLPSVPRAAACVHCRRVRRYATRWEWPALRAASGVREGDEIPRAVCAVCFGYYYPQYVSAGAARERH